MPKLRIHLLVADTEILEDGNALRFANRLMERGYEVSLGLMDSLRLVRNEVCSRSWKIKATLMAGQTYGEFITTPLTSYDVVWVLALGMRHSFLDKMQLLYNINSRVCIINSLDSLMHLKSKYFLASSDVIQYPETWASNDPEELYKAIVKDGGDWVIKPPAGSFGRDVYRVNAADSNTRVILEAMTAYEDQRYCLLQRYIPQITSGEKRVLFAGGEPIACYERTASPDHRTNLMAGGQARSSQLSEEETAYCEKIGQMLKNMGAWFVGMDMVYPWVIEMNVVTPGGMTTIDELEQRDLSAVIVNLVLDAART